MLTAYAPLFRSACARRLVAASLLSRLSFSGIFFLPLVLLTQAATGSYAVSGSALAAHAACFAASAPLRGRIIDRHGARTALPPFVVVNAATIAALPPAAAAHAGWLLVVLAGVAGLSIPPMGAAMRLEWQRILGRGDERLSQAYAFEAAAQVSLFVVGPLSAGVAVAALRPPATLEISAVMAAIPGLAFALEAGAEPAPAKADCGRLGPIRLPGVRTLVLAAALADTGLGAVELTVTAFAQQHGESAAAGALLSVFAASSVLGGTFYGSRSWRSPPAFRLALLASIGAAALLPLALAHSLVALACLLIVAGLPSTAQWAASSLALDTVAPPGGAAEAYTWLSTANGAGFAIGGLMAGTAVELGGTAVAFASAAGLVAAAAIVLVARRHTLRAPAAPERSNRRLAHRTHSPTGRRRPDAPESALGSPTYP
jgi:MFS family permease